MNEKISIIVPIYNAERYLSNCLSSILAQTFENLEIILIDDGSSDGSGEICDAYKEKDNRIVVCHQQNQGVSVARNKGLELATCEYIMFVDADDYIAPELVETLLSNLKEYDADVSVCLPLRTSNLNEVYKRESQSIDILSNLQVLEKLYCDEYTFCENYARYIAPFAKIFKAKLFEGVKFPVGRFYEDGAVMFIPLHRANKIVVSDQKMYFYYQSEGSTSRKPFDKTKLDRLTAFQDQMTYYKENGLEKLYYYAMNTYLNMFREFYWQSEQAGNIDQFGSYLKKRFRKEWGYYRKRCDFSKERRLELEEFSHPKLIGLYRKIKRDGFINSVVHHITDK